jgi:indole-3-glycerol phosphate synthase
MTTMLERMINRKRVEVARAMSGTPLAAIKSQALASPRPRNFFSAVVDERQPHAVRVIAEIQRKEPLGPLREDIEPVRIARMYAGAGAAAISCWTDSEYGGSLEDLRQVREAVALPVVRKDFIVDEWQVWESRAAGADAIVLIADVLAEGEIIDFQILATELGMTTIVEAHDVEHLLKVKNHIGFPHARYSLLAINNQDITTMSSSLSHTFRLLDFLEPRERWVVVAENGVTAREDLVRLVAEGIHVVLMGDVLLNAPDPGQALRELLGE